MGFPHHFLDWTGSPCIAAYFAFKDPPERAKHVAIFAYVEYAGGGKTSQSDKSCIEGIGPSVIGDARHERQKSEYTVALMRNKDREWFYSSHEDVFADDGEEQNLLWKCVIPVSQRRNVLKVLDSNNINEFSLFGHSGKLALGSSFL